MMAVRLRVVAVLGVLLAVVSAGCHAKKKGAGAGSSSGMEEQGLGSGDSLAQYKKGTLGAGEGGPLKDIHFAFDSFELDEQARGELRENANWLKDHPRSKIEIEGHCDERGTVEYNLALGTKRAGAAKEYLGALGIAADRLTTISYGEELPLCHDHNESCWQKNRRDHFVVLGE